MGDSPAPRFWVDNDMLQISSTPIVSTQSAANNSSANLSNKTQGGIPFQVFLNTLARIYISDSHSWCLTHKI